MSPSSCGRPAILSFLPRCYARSVRRLDPVLPLNDVTTMRRRIDDSLLIRRTPAVLAGLFATIALLLAPSGPMGSLPTRRPSGVAK